MELLASIAIVAVLAAAVAGLGQKMIKRAEMAREICAGRNLSMAYQVAAGDNDGRLLPGMDFSVNKVWFEPDKKDITMIHVPNRYPYRLAPYFDYRLDGTILVNKNKAQIEKTNPKGSMMYDYIVSTFPAFGINYNYVGGTMLADGKTLSYADDCLVKIGQDEHPLIVFASAGAKDDAGNSYNGFNLLTPPRLQQSNWAGIAWSEKVNPGNFGNVDARYDGKAVCVFTDGSTRLLSIEELRDMRLWSRKAALNNDPNYTISSSN